MPSLPVRILKNCYTFASLRITRFGEAIGSEALIYHPGVFYSFHRAGRRNAPMIADALLKEFPQIKSVADVGAGTGAYAAEFQRRGLRVVACERSPRGRKYSLKQGVQSQFFDLAFPDVKVTGLPVDLAFSLEVGEHIPASLADAFVAFLTQAADLVAFTAAPPGQGGQGHINEQPQSYWIEKFAAHGHCFDPEVSKHVAETLRQAGTIYYFCDNMMIFKRG